jgi:putative transposase
MTSTATSKRQETSNESFCVSGSAVEDRNQTWSDKLQDWLTSILEPNWSERLAAVSTSEDRRSLPYWNGSVQEISERLWSLTGIDSVGLDLSSLSGTAVSTGAKSWFSTTITFLPNRNWFRISSPSCTASVVRSTDSESTGLQSRKIRIYPEPALAKVWKRWQAACRRCYNQAIACQRQHGTPGTARKLRDIILHSDLPQWVKDAPCHIRQNAVVEAWLAFRRSKDARFRSVRDRSHTLQFNAGNFRNGTWYPKLTRGLAFRASECNHRLPRDWQGALGVMFRALRDTAFLFGNGQNAIASPLGSNVQQCSA